MELLDHGDKHGNCLIIEPLHANICQGSSVYSAADYDSGNLVVLKRFDGSYHRTGWLVDNEVKCLKKLESEEGYPRLVRLNDSLQPSYLMTYEQGKTLKEMIKGLPQQFSSDTFDYVMKIAYGISRRCEVAHKHGVIHNDIKLDNLLVSDEDKVTLIDFGISSIGKRVVFEGEEILYDNSDKDHGSSFGTPGYMAPEIWTHSGFIHSEFSDVFSLGVTLYCLFNSYTESPFYGHSRILPREINNSLPDFNHRNKHLFGHDLQYLIRAAVSKDWTDRPDVVTIRKVLEQIISEKGISKANKS